MFRLFFISFLILFPALFQKISAQENYVKGELIVMIDKGSVVEEIINVANESSNGSYDFKLVRPLAKLSGIWLVSFDSLIHNNEKVLKLMQSLSGVKYAQFNHFIQLRATPDDTQFANQYALNNTGQGGGTVDADIDAVEAWDIATGGLTALGDTIVVAVVDAGMQLTHPDLQFWKNYNEIAGNSIDDDGNGFVDDVNGWNVFTQTGNIVNDQHGTHVCGIVGARGNNNLGVTGVNWNVKIMPIVGATTVESQAVEAYSYILECRRLYNNTNGAKGAFVVASNSSFGVNQGQASNFPIWCAMYDSLGKVGVLSAAATANNNWDIDVVGDIPCSCASQYLITVSNSTRNDVKAGNAAYGVQTIDMAAPGSSIYSTYPTSTYATLSGTSMASPLVAGTVALMYAAACDTTVIDYKLFPDSVSAILKNILMNSVDQKQGFDTLFYSGGRLNVYNALVDVQNLGPCSSVGLKDLSGSALKFYPNPASDYLIIEGLELSAIESFKITDVKGEMIDELIAIDNNGKSIDVNLKKLSQGFYILSLTDRNGKSYHIKFVKVE